MWTHTLNTSIHKQTTEHVQEDVEDQGRSEPTSRRQQSWARRSQITFTREELEQLLGLREEELPGVSKDMLPATRSPASSTRQFREQPFGASTRSSTTETLVSVLKTNNEPIINKLQNIQDTLAEFQLCVDSSLRKVDDRLKTLKERVDKVENNNEEMKRVMSRLSLSSYVSAAIPEPKVDIRPCLTPQVTQQPKAQPQAQAQPKKGKQASQTSRLLEDFFKTTGM